MNTGTNPLRENEEGLFGVQWHITDNCDQRCRHCYIFAEDNKKPLVSMDFAQMQEVIRKVESFLGRMDMRPNWHITGGDPLLCPDFWKLTELMKEKKQHYILMDNPFHLNEEICRRLKDTGCVAYQVSIDGMEQTHDWFRMPGSFRKTMEVFPLLRAAGIQSVVSMTVSEKNYRELPDVMDAVERAGADHFGFARYVPTSDEKHNAIPPMEYRALLETYFQKRQVAKLCGSLTNFTLKDHLLALYLYEEGKFHPPAYCHRPGDHMPAGCHCANAPWRSPPTARSWPAAAWRAPRWAISSPTISRSCGRRQKHATGSMTASPTAPAASWSPGAAAVRPSPRR